MGTYGKKLPASTSTRPGLRLHPPVLHKEADRLGPREGPRGPQGLWYFRSEDGNLWEEDARIVIRLVLRLHPPGLHKEADRLGPSGEPRGPRRLGTFRQVWNFHFYLVSTIRTIASPHIGGASGTRVFIAYKS